MPSVEGGIQLKKNSKKPLRVLFPNTTRSLELGSPEQYQAFLKVLPVLRGYESMDKDILFK